MSHLEKINDKIISLEALKLRVENWKSSSEKIVFTNGCFDILHRGHIDVLAKTADLGDKLIIGLNSDSSIRKLKEDNRPIVDEKSRAFKSAVNRLATRKAKREAETEGYLREFSEASIGNIAIILAETLSVEQIEELCTLLNQPNETQEEQNG